MSPFDRWLAFLAPHEGGWSDDPDDHGGRTRFGISQAANPDVDLEALAPDKLHALIRERYWEPIGGEALAALAPQLVIAVADYGFNSGTSLAVRDLQREVGANPDGVVGPQTLETVAYAVSGSDGQAVQGLNDRRRAFLRRVSERSGQGKFLAGWLKRVDDLDLLLERAP